MNCLFSPQRSHTNSEVPSQNKSRTLSHLQVEDLFGPFTSVHTSLSSSSLLRLWKLLQFLLGHPSFLFLLFHPISLKSLMSQWPSLYLRCIAQLHLCGVLRVFPGLSLSPCRGTPAHLVCHCITAPWASAPGSCSITSGISYFIIHYLQETQDVLYSPALVSSELYNS